MDKKNFKYLLPITFFLFFVCMAISASSVYAENIIYPGDERWTVDIREGATAEITGENPRNGNGSLALSTSGSLLDWAFYTTYAGDDISTASWGLLSEISIFSFDWYRENVGMDGDYVSYDPWIHQTPVLRLLVRDIDDSSNYIYSELIWEKWYTDLTTPLILDKWVEEDVLNSNFWRYSFDYGYTLNTGINVENLRENNTSYDLLALSVISWSDAYNILYPYSSEAVVYGLSVGVGSAWPDEYEGYVDNVLLAFNDTAAVDDNFELPVPEPATFMLLGAGLITMVIGRKRYLRR